MSADPSTYMTSFFFLQAADTEFSGAVARVGPHQLVEFAEDKISLKITENGTNDNANGEIELENGWSITPLTGLEVSLDCAITYKADNKREFLILLTDCKAPG